MKELLLAVLPSALSGEPRDQLLYVVALTVLVLGTVLCCAALRVAELDVPGVAVAGAGAAAWLLSNGSAEGTTLVVVLPGNGLTTADLAVLPAAALVAVLCWRRLQGARDVT